MALGPSVYVHDFLSVEDEFELSRTNSEHIEILLNESRTMLFALMMHQHIIDIGIPKS